MDTEFAVRMVDITKHFGTITANKNVSLDIRKGEILSLLGENGSGKTTLMNMLSGIYYPDGGSIYVNGTRVDIRSPKDAFKLHIGMIHQHFKLVDVFTATENVKLGLKDSISAVRKSIVEICKKYSFAVDPDKKVYEMSVSEKQTLEIVKVLYRGADILILDEPTAVLTPQETEALFKVMRAMKADGKSIVIITHKLHEVLVVTGSLVKCRKPRRRKGLRTFRPVSARGDSNRPKVQIKPRSCVKSLRSCAFARSQARKQRPQQRQ